MSIDIKKEIYEDAQILKMMKAPDKIKVKILGDLLIRYENIWRVVGITEQALKVFAKHDFKKVSKMGINRSHLQDRHRTYPYLFNENLSFKEWWNYLKENNDCILATASENMKGNSGVKIISIDTNLNLFKSKGFSWNHRLCQEGAYLKKLYEQNQYGDLEPRST